MTDNKIMKALSNISYGGHSCIECEHRIDKGEERCGLKGCYIARNALDLINRQKIELERSRELLEMAEKAMKIANEDADLMREQYKCVKAEAIREFAEELMFNLDGDIEAYANAGHGLNVYEWLYSYMRSKRAIKEEGKDNG